MNPQQQLLLDVEPSTNNYVTALAEFEHYKPLKEFHPVHLVYSSKLKKYTTYISSPTKGITYYKTNKIILSTNKLN